MLVVPTVFHRKDQVDNDRQQREQHKIEEFNFACHNPSGYRTCLLNQPDSVKDMPQSMCRADSLIPPKYFDRRYNQLAKQRQLW
jgi:hypothetical protein